MLFFWQQEITNEILPVSKYLSQFDQQFILTPLVRFEDKPAYNEALSKLSQAGKNINVAPVYLKSKNSNFSSLLNPNIVLSDFLSMRKVIVDCKPDVIVCFYLSHAYPLALLKKFSDFSLCTVAMGSDVNLDNSFLQKIARKFVLRNSDLIFARSWQLKDKIEKEGFKTIVSPSSTDTSFFRELNEKAKLRSKWNIDPTDQVMLTVCRLDLNKGVDTLLKSVDKLKNEKIKLLIVGDGVERKNLERFSASMGLDKKVFFMGTKSKMELLELYNLSDVFVLASYSEGLPRVLLEAMACGCIPIVTDVGSVGTVVASGYNGLLTEPGNSFAITKYVQEIFQMPEEEFRLMKVRAMKSIEGFDSGKVWRTMIDTINNSVSDKNFSSQRNL